ncbi:hypothetical protein SB521682_4097 [Shigella boydii 5216-82]|nr:hypothetical protein SB521682_4097 [Shigella boydii 5216-82]
MDGFEANGLRLFSLSIPEPSVKNLFAVKMNFIEIMMIS